MPVSPADFEFYSRMTGRPIPADPAARMRMAPEVYAMRRGPLNRVAGALGSAAKAALMGGAVVGGGLLVKNLVEGMGQEAAPSTTTSDVNLDTPKATSAPQKGPEIGIEEGVHGYRRDTDGTKYGNAEISASSAGYSSIDEARRALQQKYAPRVSHQTSVPQADPNITNESFDAQRASVSEPTAPIKGGASTQGQSAVDNVVAQAAEFFEGAGRGVSPFQAGGAMNELARQSRQVKETVGGFPKALQGPLAQYISNRSSVPAPEKPESAPRMAGSIFTTQIPGSSAVASVTLDPQNPEYMGIAYGKTPDKTYSQAVTPTFGRAVMSQMDRLSDPAQSEMEQSEMGSFGKMVAGMKKSGAMTKAGTPAPELLPGARPVFVTDKGRQVRDVAAKAQERKLANNAKRDARAAELDDTLAKGAAHLPLEQRIQQRNQILEKEGY